ncbi:MAG TPA: hypothetical protein VHE35_16355, partial [Kofleriaceae bacterium]|nr:hypothetical protein [Kofleriaceae bacterium]
MRNRQLPLLLAIPLVSLAACNWNEVENGRLGKVQLTPSNCGLPGCDLDDGIAVGGTFDLTMSGTAGVDVSDLQLVSSAPWIVDVISSDGLAGEPTFRIAGNGAGLADLVAIDRYGYEVDYLPVEVADIAAFDVITTADGMAQSTVPGIGEVIEVRGGTQVTLDVEGTSRGRALLGDVQYLVELDPS